ncbi:TOMM precursor leader peptide-binding protein [Streptomyces sp. NPDC092296]|uniref:TOMM precursor leader peptide-binding protein n=1 Tax=Streptomyces sp. NPDC092296 TaxID=3366012 RepID=UPI0037FEAB94
MTATGEQETAGPAARGARAGAVAPVVGFKRHLRAAVVPGEAVYLLSGRGVTALHGDHTETLLPLLDGTRTLPEVVEQAARSMPAAEAAAALRRLADAGLVRGRTPGRPADPAAEAYWDQAGLDGGRAAAEVAGAPVRVVALGGAESGAEAARGACRASGLAVRESAEGTALTLVLCDDYLDPRLAALDAEHRAAGRPWLLAKPGGAVPWVGPVFRPGEGACWHCLAERLRGHRRSERPVQHALGLDGPVPLPEASLAAGRALGLNAAVLEAAKWLAGLRYEGQGSVRTLDTLELGSTAHRVVRRPQCAGCGDPGLVAARVGAPVVPVSRPKAPHDGNGHRALTPQQMLERYGHLVSPVTGVVRELRRDPRGPEFVECYLSGQNLAVGSGTLAGLRAGLRALSGGKGLTADEARVSALGEAVERYCGSRQGDEPTFRASLRELGAAAVHPNDCQLYGERQFRDRDRWNAVHSHFQYVSAPFDERAPVDWTPVWSLTADRQRLLPTSLLYFDAGESGACGLRADSNGNAAGGSLEDALVQGFLELVERDAVALWWYNRTRQPAVDLGSFDAPWLAPMLAGYRRSNREVWALDLTSDLGIPVVAALSRRTDKPAEDVVFGFGAHFDPAVAMRRALTEMGQLLPGAARARPDGTGYTVTDPEPYTWWTRATVANQPYLLPDPAQSVRTRADWAYTPRGDLAADVAEITRLVTAHGMELLVLDQTRPDIGLPVVKVIVPGLRHFWARFAPGRLFDVPVALGRLAEPTRYEDLNPIPLFV